MNASCPGGCSGHGICTLRGCVCDSELYGGPTCGRAIWQGSDSATAFARITAQQAWRANVVVDADLGSAGWLVTLDNFASLEEVAAIIDAGHGAGFAACNQKRRPSKTSLATHSIAYLPQEIVPAHAKVNRVIRRIEQLTAIPRSFYEQMPIVKYRPGERFLRHHDSFRLPFPRVLTAFLYLNENFSAGATHFTDINVSVHPRAGRLAVWSNVGAQDSTKSEGSMWHSGSAPQSGVKYGVNLFIRLFPTAHCGTTQCGGTPTHGVKLFKSPRRQQNLVMLAAG